MRRVDGWGTYLAGMVMGAWLMGIFWRWGWRFGLFNCGLAALGFLAGKKWLR